MYAGYSCGSCHRNAGRTKPALWTQTGTDPDGTPVYGSGAYGFSSMLVYISRKNGAFFQNYGRVLHDQSIYGVKAEGKLECRWHYQKYQFPDGGVRTGISPIHHQGLVRAVWQHRRPHYSR